VIGSKCGFPGLPQETNIDPDKSIYEDGEEVRIAVQRMRSIQNLSQKMCGRCVDWPGIYLWLQP